MSKKTPLFDWHVGHGAKMLEFGDYLMPLSYEGVLAEHRAVRERCGLFDISHMGEFFFEGEGAQGLVQGLTSNDVGRLRDQQVQYSLLLNEKGYALDDIFVYRLNPQRYMFCVNADNIGKDYAWIQSQPHPSVQMEDRSEKLGMLALQGPTSAKVLQKLGFDLNGVERFGTMETKLADVPVLLSRTGYTGEDGCELFVESTQLVELWEALMAAGQGEGLIPIGLGARDTLRLEMGYILYGHELNEEINPLEAGLSWVIKLEGGDFIGKEALIQFKKEGLRRKLIGLVMEDPGVPREGMDLCLANGEGVGKVLSGSSSPTLKKGIATALIETQALPPNGEIFVDIRGKMKKAKIQRPPFIEKKTERNHL